MRARDIVGSALRGEADCHVKLGRKAEAIAALEKSFDYDYAPYLALDVALARGTLGRLLADTGRDRARGIALVRTALDELATLDDPDVADDPTRKQLATWLARHDNKKK